MPRLSIYSFNFAININGFKTCVYNAAKNANVNTISKQQQTYRRYKVYE